MLICSSAKESAGTDSRKAVNNLMQSFNIHGAYNGMNAIQSQERAYPDVNYRYYFTDEPTDSCNVVDLLNFNNETTWCLQEAGREEAKNTLMKRSLNEWEKQQEEMTAKSEMFDKVKALWNKLF